MGVALAVLSNSKTLIGLVLEMKPVAIDVQEQ